MNTSYQLVHAGWHNQRRKYGCLLHLDLKDGKMTGNPVSLRRFSYALGLTRPGTLLYSKTLQEYSPSFQSPLPKMRY
ncbi:MAG: hypothetical protein DWI57_12850 [Chloroflexi bacterium]|nr:MAG: hypothetical protein DWI57_12850 [Chloroflexota bacterium]